MFSNKVNKVIILSTGKTPGEIFVAKAHHSYFTLFAFFHLHYVIDKIPTWKLFTLTLMEKSKADSTDFCEISPEHSRDNNKPKGVGKF